MRSKPVIVLLSITVAAISAVQTSAQGSSDLRLNPVTQQSENRVFMYLGGILRAGRYVGRVYYEGTCRAGGFGSVGFPEVRVHLPRGNTALSAVREMFQADADVRVTEKKDKIMSVTFGGPSIAMLQTRISVLKVPPMAAYNPTAAIGVIEGTSEVKAAMSKLHLQFPLLLSAQLIAEPSPGLPHLPTVMEGVTVGQALDAIAVTFRGIVAYGTCAEASGRSLAEIDFFGLGSLSTARERETRG